jgi:hypothetical protein
MVESNRGHSLGYVRWTAFELEDQGILTYSHRSLVSPLIPVQP